MRRGFILLTMVLAAAFTAWLLLTTTGGAGGVGTASRGRLDTLAQDAGPIQSAALTESSTRVKNPTSRGAENVWSGRVMERETRRPVPEAQIWFTPSIEISGTLSTSTSDAEGRFSVLLTGPGRVERAIVSAPGMATQGVKPKWNAAGSVELEVEPGLPVDILVLDAVSKKPIEGFGAAFHASELDWSGLPLPVVKDTALGRSTLRAPEAGDRSLVVVAPGYPIFEERAAIQGGLYIVEMPAAASIAVKVLRGGKPAAEAPVSLYFASSRDRFGRPSSAPKGFEVTEASVADSPFGAPPNGPMGFTWHPTDIDNRKLRAPAEERQHPTNAAGIATFVQIPPLPVVARTWDETGQAFDSAPVLLEPGGRGDIELTILIPGSVKGRVLGIPRPDTAWISLYDDSPRPPSAAAKEIARARIGPDGSFDIPRILPGLYIAVLGFPHDADNLDLGSPTSVHFTVREGETASITLDARREPCGTIHLRLDVSGLVPGELYFRWIRHKPQPTRWSEPVPIPVDGNLEMPFVRTGEVWYSIETAGHEVLRSHGPFRVDTDAITPIRDTLRIGLLRVRVVNPPEREYHGNLHISFPGLAWKVDRVFDSSSDLTIPCAEGIATASVEFGSRLWKAEARVAGGVETLLELRESK